MTLQMFLEIICSLFDTFSNTSPFTSSMEMVKPLVNVIGGTTIQKLTASLLFFPMVMPLPQSRTISLPPSAEIVSSGKSEWLAVMLALPVRGSLLLPLNVMVFTQTL